MPKKKCPYNDRNGFAYVYVNRKPVALKAPDGSRCKTGTPEADTAFYRFYAELHTNPTFLAPKNEQNVTLDEVAAAYLDYANRRFGKTEYGHYRTHNWDLLPMFQSGRGGIRSLHVVSLPACIMIRNVDNYG